MMMVVLIFFNFTKKNASLGILRNFLTGEDLFYYDPIFPIFSPLSTPEMKLVIYRYNTEFYLLAFCFAH
jgi:hypothetical protein